MKGVGIRRVQSAKSREYVQFGPGQCKCSVNIIWIAFVHHTMRQSSYSSGILEGSLPIFGAQDSFANIAVHVRLATELKMIQTPRSLTCPLESSSNKSSEKQLRKGSMDSISLQRWSMQGS